MKNIILFFLLGFLICCKPNFKKKFTIDKNEKAYKIWITYYGTKKDTIAINWLLYYQINNKTNRGIKFFRFRKRPLYLLQNALMIKEDSLTFYDRLNDKKSSREILLYCSKLVSVKDFPNDFLENKNVMFSLNESEKNVSKIPTEQKNFMKSTYFQNILKEIEQDSIAIVFRDSVVDDYFQFKGVIKDKELKFSR